MYLHFHEVENMGLRGVFRPPPLTLLPRSLYKGSTLDSPGAMTPRLLS